MLFLSKLLPVFVYPLGLTLTLLAFAFVLSFTRFRKLLRTAVALAFVTLFVASLPAVGNALLSRLETRHPPRPVADHAPADVAILLGGALGQPLPPRLTPDVGEPGDRILHAWRLWREGKVAKIIVSGGNLPWQLSAAPESELIAAMLRELGVPAEAILLDRASRNTFENAVESRAIWTAKGFRRGYLVTSAAHMPRALAVFRRAGLPVEPSPTDFRVRMPLYDSVLDFLPDAEALARTTAAIRELIGLGVYRMRGWA
jgi:uncharacterized SAM-binding protein YcdF (DUF218 family)